MTRGRRCPEEDRDEPPGRARRNPPRRCAAIAGLAMTADLWIDRFEGLSRLSPDIRETLVARSRIVEAPNDTVIFGPGKAPEHMLLLLDGTVRVQQASESRGARSCSTGSRPGQSCVLTTACLLAHDAYSCRGRRRNRCVAPPPFRGPVFDDLVAQFAGRSAHFVFAAFSRAHHRPLPASIDEVAFRARGRAPGAERLLAPAAGAAETVRDDAPANSRPSLAPRARSISRQLQEFQQPRLDRAGARRRSRSATPHSLRPRSPPARGLSRAALPEPLRVTLSPTGAQWCDDVPCPSRYGDPTHDPETFRNPGHSSPYRPPPPRRDGHETPGAAMTETVFTPWHSLGGGVLIGLAAVLMMLALGRIMGATGILSGVLPPVSNG